MMELFSGDERRRIHNFLQARHCDTIYILYKSVDRRRHVFDSKVENRQTYSRSPP